MHKKYDFFDDGLVIIKDAITLEILLNVEKATWRMGRWIICWA